MSRLLQLFIAIGLSILAVATVAAQESSPLSLAAAISEALRSSPDLAAADDAVRLAGVAERLASSDFALKFTPAVSAGTDPAAGRTRNAAVNVSKQLSTGATLFANLSTYEFGSPSAKLRDNGYTVGVSQPLLRGFATT